METIVSISPKLKINTIEKFAILSIGSIVLWNANFESYFINQNIAAFLDDRQKIISKVRNYSELEIIQ